MENRAYALAAGLFVIILGLALLATTVWFTGGIEERVPYSLVAKTPVTGLNVKAAVRFRGVDVGKVESIQFDPGNPRQNLVSVAVAKGTPITRGTYARLAYQGVAGLSYINLDDDGTNPEPLPSPGPIEVRPSLIDQVGASAPELLDNAAQAAKRVNTLLSDDNLARLTRLISNLDTMSGNLAALLKNFQPVARTLPPLAARADTTLRKMDPLLTNLNGLTTDVRSRVTAFDRVSASADEVGQASRALQEALTHDTLPRLHGLSDELSRSSRAFGDVLRELREQPQSLIFGRRAPSPGPGEPGFKK
jgi:phospholipid/cholesterol/gamma-HCH transport system substrate-binding protein